MRILFATWKLDNHVGSELFAKELAIALKNHGHEPVIHAPVGGRLSDEAAAHGVEVIGDLRKLRAAPDIIHGQHPASLLLALRDLPRTPAVWVVHATAAIFEPFPFSRILRYVAVDDRCAEWTAKHLGMPREKVRLILNFADLARFKPRAPLPARPARALIFSNYANGETHLEPIRSACARLDLPLDVLGGSEREFAADPERILPAYDLVFAKARCAIEAMAAGTAVILCDFPGLGPMVTVENFAALRRMNFGAGVLTRPLDPAAIAQEIAKYDAGDAMAVARRIRREGSLERAVEEWIALYAGVVREAQGSIPDIGADASVFGSEARKWRAFLLGARVIAIPILGPSLYRFLRYVWRQIGEPLARGNVSS